MSEAENAVKNENSKPQKTFAIIKKVLWAIVCGIFFAVLIVVLWLGVDKFVLKSPVPSVLGFATLTVETGSMENEINIGDMILIKDTGDYKIGDIVTYIREGDTIPTTHRIINYAEGGFITKGDANNTKDTDTVTPDMILGEVIKIVPKGGLFAKWVREEGWMYIAVILLIVALGTFVLKAEVETSADKKNASLDSSNTQNPEGAENAQKEGSKQEESETEQENSASVTEEIKDNKDEN